jgi:hypothetical protein
MLKVGIKPVVDNFFGEVEIFNSPQPVGGNKQPVVIKPLFLVQF